MHGTYPANMAVTHSDLLFAVGTRFDDRATGKLSKFAPEARIIHIDIDPAAIARNVPVEIPIVGDALNILEKIYPLLRALSIDDWLERIERWKKEHPLKVSNSNNALAAEQVVKTISEVFPDAIISTEVGQNQMWTALFYNFRIPRRLLTSGGLGTMGYGFPAAIGAQLGNPGKTVIDIAGDGSIQMNIQELATAVHNRLPVIVAILNNGYLGMVRQWQDLFFNKRYSSTCLRTGPVYRPDFVKLAEAYGAVGMRVTKMEDVRQSLLEAGKSRTKPVLIDFIVERETNVFPMVPAGGAISEMMFDRGGEG
ncbi:Acetolactate synthase isozyme 3 large subunit [subsurface metagenome]